MAELFDDEYYEGGADDSEEAIAALRKEMEDEKDIMMPGALVKQTVRHFSFTPIHTHYLSNFHLIGQTNR
jgi:hypothetical protein